MKIILTSHILDILDKNNELCIFKYTIKNNIASYYFGPNISIKLWQPKVSWLNHNSCSFQFKKSENLNLLILLRNINSRLVELYSLYKESRGFVKYDLLPCIFYEKDDFFYIKCNLPYANHKYLINTSIANDTNIEEKTDKNTRFEKPKIGIVYQSIILDIRNVWEVTNETVYKVGFKLELKEVELQ